MKASELFIRKIDGDGVTEAPDVDALKAIMREFVGEMIERGLFVPGGCLHLTALLLAKLKAAGTYRAVFQAGTAMFRRLPETPEGDDAELFSFTFGGGAPVKLDGVLIHDPADHSYDLEAPLDKMCSGVMPEVHCWIALPDCGVVLDPAAALVPELCYQSMGLEWKMPRPKTILTLDEFAMPGMRSHYFPDTAAMLAVPLFFSGYAGSEVHAAAKRQYDAQTVADIVTVSRWLKRDVGWPERVKLSDLGKDGIARKFIRDVRAADIEQQLAHERAAESL